jgi:tetratricopeptide (TPR) repeat protein
MKRQTVSLCLLARNQEATIGMAIKSVLALVDEVVVVDLGSTDNTRIIAEGYGARVLDFTWSDDFAAARNAGLEEASCHWALVMDAHEFLQPIRPVEFQRLLHDPGVAGYRMYVGTGPTGDPRDGRTSLRLFRLGSEIRYRYPIFEQLEPALSAWAYPQGLIISQVDLTVMTDSDHQDGSSRQRETNMRILRKALDAHPEEPYFPYRLACENIQVLDGEVLPVAGLNKALGHLSQAWRLLSKLPGEQVRDLGWVPDLAIKAASGLGTLGRADEAGPVIRRVRQLFPTHPGVRLQAIATEIQILHGSQPLGEGHQRNQQATQLEAELQSLRLEGQHPGLSSADKRVYSLYSLRYLGEMALLEGRVSQAVGHFEQALSLDPEYSFAWLGMAECSRFAGDRKRALKLYLRTVTESEWNFRAWLRGCDLMLEMGFGDNAASWWHRAGNSFPEHPEVLAGAADGSGREPALQLNG